MFFIQTDESSLNWISSLNFKSLKIFFSLSSFNSSSNPQFNNMLHLIQTEGKDKLFPMNNIHHSVAQKRKIQFFFMFRSKHQVFQQQKQQQRQRKTYFLIKQLFFFTNFSLFTEGASEEFLYSVEFINAPSIAFSIILVQSQLARMPLAKAADAVKWLLQPSSQSLFIKTLISNRSLYSSAFTLISAIASPNTIVTFDIDSTWNLLIAWKVSNFYRVQQKDFINFQVINNNIDIY